MQWLDSHGLRYSVDAFGQNDGEGSRACALINATCRLGHGAQRTRLGSNGRI